jgi:hypothetical protein
MRHNEIRFQYCFFEHPYFDPEYLLDRNNFNTFVGCFAIQLNQNI